MVPYDSALDARSGSYLDVLDERIVDLGGSLII